MNQKQLIQKIVTKELKINVYLQELGIHKRYFAQLKWNKVTYIGLLIPFLIGFNLRNTKDKMSHKVVRYSKLLALTLSSQVQNKLFASVYAHLEQFIKNKLAK